MLDSVPKITVTSTLTKYGFSMVDTIDEVEYWISPLHEGTVVQISTNHRRYEVFEFELIAETIGVHHWDLDYILDNTHSN